MQLFNNLTLIVREKPQGFTNFMIVLPDSKYTTSKMGLVLKSSSKEAELKTGDRIVALQYDFYQKVKAWADLEFDCDQKTYPDRLPEGITIENGKIKVKEGTELQILDDTMISAVLLEGQSISD